MLRPEDLLGFDDFVLGELTFSPSRRVVERGGESVALEPRVMQVLVLLARSAGEVVSRQRLFDEIWGGVPVGEDSLNRAIAGARKALALDGENLSLETIPRTGYRLHVDQAAAGPRLSRRQVALAGGIAAGLAGMAGLGLWLGRRSEAEREFADAMTKGREAVAYGDASGQAADHFRRAATIRPDDPGALGLLAFSQALRVDSAGEVDPEAVLREAEAAKLAALRLDPQEPNARLAEVVLQRPMLDFASTEDRLRTILRSDPGNLGAMRQYWNMLQCVGRSRNALGLVERSLTIAPLAAGNHFPRAQLLWIVGRPAEADRVIERATSYWPTHRWVRFARFTILAFSGRAAAARAMLDDDASRPQSFTPAAVALWRINLDALAERSPSAIAAAREAGLAQGTRNLQLASSAVLTLSELGETDAAFELTSALFAARPPTGRSQAGPSPARGTAWRFAPWLFTPPLASVRADPRFAAICDAAGLTDYWARRGVTPDYRARMA